MYDKSTMTQQYDPNLKKYVSKYDEIARFTCDFYSDSKFVAKSSYSNDYFRDGQKIVFKRT